MFPKVDRIHCTSSFGYIPPEFAAIFCNRPNRIDTDAGIVPWYLQYSGFMGDFTYLGLRGMTQTFLPFTVVIRATP
jgi:hypothetical protein